MTALRLLSWRSLRTSLVILLITAGLFWAVDWTYGLFFPVKSYAGHAERLTLSAYKQERYFSEAFLEESFVQPGGWETLQGTRVVLPRPFSGKYFHVDTLEPTGLTYRRTINPVVKGMDRRVVLVLGGSTIYNSEVPDELTVPSQLSSMLNQRDGARYVVLNAGVSSVNTTQERERLELELARGLRPWAVVCLNGINDVNQGVYFGQPEGVMFSGEQRNRLKEWMKAVLPLNIWRGFRVRAEQEKARTLPGHLNDAARVEALASQSASVYLRNVEAMHALSKKHGARFWSILQPHFFSTRHEQHMPDIGEIENLTERTLPKTRIVFDAGYRALRVSVAELSSRGVAASDASTLFAAKKENIFLDMAHVNSVGNRMLAEHLAGLILAEQKRSEP